MTALGDRRAQSLIAAADATDPAAWSPVLPARHRFALGAVAWALAIIYASVIIGPDGFKYVPRDLDEAWRLYLATPYVVHGSDQRADWMGNLLMLVPLGFTLTGLVWPRRARLLRWLGAGLALVICVAFVLAVKYAQLFVEARTVTLNYIFAQSLGSLAGVVLFWVSHRRVFGIARIFAEGGRRAFNVILTIYAISLCLFFLVPFDFVLSAGDLRDRLTALPQIMLSWPGADRPTSLRIILVLVGTATTVPLGMLLASVRPRLSQVRVIATGFVMMVAVCVATMFVLTATPYLVAIAYRTVGIVIGAALMKTHFERRTVAALRLALARIVPAMSLPYVLAVLFINGLLASHWQTFGEALAAFDTHGLLPFWHHYIVPKAQAVLSVVVEVVTYAPIGVMVSLRGGRGRGGAVLAAILAAALSLTVEIGRLFRPGLQPDLTNPIIAFAAAWFVVKLMPFVWRIVEDGPDAGALAVARDVASRPAMDRVLAPPAALVRAKRRSAEEAHPRAVAVGWLVAASSIALASAIVAHYPIYPWLLGASLAVYGAILWRWPGAWLVIVPALLPALDLTPWTGWFFVGEPDLFILVTIAILALRAPPRNEDVILLGWPGGILLLFVAVYCVSLAFGLSLPGPVLGSDNPYLRSDNALRLAKGFFAALALLPFFRARLRTHRDALEKFGIGMLTGLLCVGAAAIVERALFPGLLDFTSDYRVVATFASMHAGGGLIGAYVALSLPFLIACLIRPRVLKLVAMIVIAAIASYTLVVTFARTAYATALVSMIAVCAGWALATARYRKSSYVGLILPAFLVVPIGAIIVMASFDGTFMSGRLETIGPDLATREANWSGGLKLSDDGVAATLLGMGLGTYPRLVLARGDPDYAPTNYLVKRGDGSAVLWLRVGSSFYWAQRVSIESDVSYTLSLRMRALAGPREVSVLLCENTMLYSDHCRGPTFQAAHEGEWQPVRAKISSSGLGEPRIAHWLKRPVILSLSSPAGSTVEIANITLLDPQGKNIVLNGDFATGTSRWYFTSDDHLAWRIKNQYLMTLFEGGAFGLLAFLALACGGVAGASMAARQGDLMAAGVVASLISFLCSGLFDYLLEAPRLATIFYLVCLVGLSLARSPGPTISPHAVEE